MNGQNKTGDNCKVRPSWSIRLLQMLTVGTLIWFIFMAAGFQYEGIEGVILTWIQNVLITFLTWESLEFCIGKVEQYFSWRKHPVYRFAIQALVVPVVSVFTIGVPMYLFSWLYFDNTEITTGFRIMLVIGVLFSLVISTIFSAMDFYRQSLRAALEVEQLKEEGLRSQLESLRQQVNPHFLFNSLNVLSALIPIDSERALVFVQYLSKVYRYVLDSGKSELADIRDEMNFLEAYAFLLQQRFGESLRWEIIQDPELKGKIPSLSLQILAENAVKHNVVSIARPLTIQVQVGNGVVRIQNNLQLKNSPEPSTGLGLDNISQRYILAGYPAPVIHQTDYYFEVVLPLIP